MAMGIDYYSYPPHVSTLCGKTEITEDNYDIFEEKKTLNSVKISD